MSEKRTISKTVKFNESEKSLIKAMSEIKDVTESEFIRQCLFGGRSVSEAVAMDEVEKKLKELEQLREENRAIIKKHAKASQEINKAVMEFRKYAMNINQIAKYLNTKKTSTPTSKDIQEIERANDELVKVHHVVDRLRNEMKRSRE